ncbi:MAG: outer membrane lipoprotein carrier protein LolA [Flavobacteriaceae bacterium]|jgi:outer membrane lipoprotein-sorting protein|nr:outer membrane lipoprotein carrier protein LolA [Flavobacteriaceae bacterium]MBT5395121.1 outer membrane lipoprotein carrier protein LolA [Flavobacteriaceae bacterium]MBT5585946.1 outer membrane lipoprotein carrier protein LolA [Flavobacteriaceae bacterium]MBT5920669.1 outer membrane lipoprotein carrier protein LolA [Flavobacteriaceae bacterium]MBT7240841.1 outer membrane lipoprotein carrier protein LolA [Flavobacteriaceae bacterium]|tara:strand:+ start:2348 stop:2995 length:648 start_codon:yes stop_codon:yes gene_type:complete
MKSKKMNKIFLLLISICSFAWSQDASKVLLKEVSDKLLAQENISLQFNYTLFNAEANINQETSGKVQLKGEKYRFEYLGIIQLNDTKNTYTIVPENEEVTIVSNENAGSEMNPAKILNFYNEGYRFQWDIAQNIGNRKIQYIKLVPIDSSSDIAYILLGIDNQKKEVYKVIETGKNGTQTTITITKYETNTNLAPNLFSFEEKKYIDLGYYIIKE